MIRLSKDQCRNSPVQHFNFYMEEINNWLICWKFANAIKLGATENTNEDKEIIARNLV